MVVEKMETMRDCLVDKVWGQMSHLDTTDAKEMGEVVDMIKDFETALYYHGLTEQLEEEDEEEEEDEMEYAGHSAWCRNMYMKDKKANKDIACRTKDLENYISSLDKDIFEMMTGFTPEEHRMLHTQMMTLADKIGHMTI